MNNKEIKIDERRKIKNKKYFLVFLITLAIFITGILLSQQFNFDRIENIQEVEDNMYLNILSSEIQSALLEETGCKGINEKTVLSSELRGLKNKLSYMENEVKMNSPEFINLKKKYELLQIKDYLLMKKLAKKCELEPINILYFYSQKDEKLLDNSKKQSYVLEKLERDNPRLRVYYFDYDLPLPAVRTLLIAKKIDGNKLPALVIENQKYLGFQSLEKVQKLLPKLKIFEDKYLKYSDGSKSKVKIQCTEDKQCYVKNNILNQCGLPIAINKDNDEKDILEFFKKEKEIAKTVKAKCIEKDEYQKEVFCDLEKHICQVKQKDNNPK